MSQRWYPVSSDLKDPAGVERSFRQLLTQHYALQDRLEAMQSEQQAPAQASASGPVDTKLLGLRVQPIDTKTLADGATLKWDRASGTFKFA
jgi:uncharacterized protein involved in copper resistance